MRFRWRWLSLAMAAMFILPACGVQQLARGEIQPPKVTFQGLALGNPTSRGWPVVVSLLLTNPNDESLNLRGYNCELWLEGKDVAQTASDAPVNLPARGQTVAQVPILVKLPAVVGLVPMLLQPEPPPLHYQVAGSFRLGSVLGGLIPVPFRFQGQVTPKQGLGFLRSYLR